MHQKNFNKSQAKKNQNRLKGGRPHFGRRMALLLAALAIGAIALGKVNIYQNRIRAQAMEDLAMKQLEMILASPYDIQQDCHDTKIPGQLGYCTEECPCDEGEGDCDPNRGECAEGLQCIENAGAKFGFFGFVDVCMKSEEKAGGNAVADLLLPSGPDMMLTGIMNSAAANCGMGSPGSWDYCSKACPCGEGQGDCDPASDDCAEGLVCVPNQGMAYGLGPNVDICIRTEQAQSPADFQKQTCHVGEAGNMHYCTETCPCKKGEGDCDSDAQCADGLKCVPAEEAGADFPSFVDVCN